MNISEEQHKQLKTLMNDMMNFNLVKRTTIDQAIERFESIFGVTDLSKGGNGTDSVPIALSEMPYEIQEPDNSPKKLTKQEIDDNFNEMVKEMANLREQYINNITGGGSRRNRKTKKQNRRLRRCRKKSKSKRS